MGVYYDSFRRAETDAVVPRTSAWILYNGPADEMVLVGDVPDEFRLAFVLTAIGTVTLSEEILTFESATRLTTAETFTEIPEVEVDTEGDISVECITPYGAPIMQETLEDIKIVYFPKTSIIRDKSGSGWQQTDYNIFTDTVLHIGDCIRFYDSLQGRDIEVYVKNVDPGIDLVDGHVEYRMLQCA